FSEMGPGAKSTVPFLLKLLQKRSLPLTGKLFGPVHRGAVIRTLGKIGPDASAAVPALVAIFKSEKYRSLRRETALALGEVGPPASQAVPELLAVLNARDAIWWASVALLATPTPASAAVLPLVKMGRTPDIREAYILNTIREALQRIDPNRPERLSVP